MLVDGDDMNEPIADAVRSILDGHVVLTRELAHAGHYPAIDVLQSVSRLTSEILTPKMQARGPARARAHGGVQRQEDLIAIGAYEHGPDPLTDQAIALRDPIDGFLRQHATDGSNANTADTGSCSSRRPRRRRPRHRCRRSRCRAGYAPAPGAAARRARSRR